MLTEGMTLLEQLQDRADILQENGYQYEPLEDAIQLIQEMREDLIYLNKMCMTLMSLLPPETTPEDVRAAMAKQGSHVREEKRIITDV